MDKWKEAKGSKIRFVYYLSVIVILPFCSFVRLNWMFFFLKKNELNASKILSATNKLFHKNLCVAITLYATTINKRITNRTIIAQYNISNIWNVN